MLNTTRERAGRVLLCAALSTWTVAAPTVLRGQATPLDDQPDRVSQSAEAGTRTRAVHLRLPDDQPDATIHRLCEPGARWLRVQVGALRLSGRDSVELRGDGDTQAVFLGPAHSGRRFFTRALPGACLQVRAHLEHARSFVRFDAVQSGRQALANLPVPVAAVGDLCDATEHCAATAALVAAFDPVKLILAGDNAYESGTLGEYNKRFAPHYGRFKDRMLPAPGNHEYNTGGAQGYFDYFNGVGVFTGPAGPRDRGYYSTDVGEWHVVMLNSSIARHAGSTQEQWLRADLAASTKPCTLASFHHPRFSIGAYAPGDASVQALYQALQDYRADILVVGHDHNYQRWMPKTATGMRDRATGLRQFVVGTGGRGLYAVTASADVAASSASTWGLLKLLLRSDGYDFEFVPVAGGTFTDSGSAGCKAKGVLAPSYSLALHPDMVSVARGTSSEVTLSATSHQGFSLPITPQCAGLPAELTCTFVPAQVTPPPNGSVDVLLRLIATDNARPGSSDVAVGASPALDVPAAHLRVDVTTALSSAR